MKKIKLSTKLNLNKMVVSELNNSETIIGGISGAKYCGNTKGAKCDSSPVCCLSHTCPTNNIKCEPEPDTGIHVCAVGD